MSETITILVVDDEPLNRELLRRVLQSAYAVEEAADASEALAYLERQQPVGLMLCDHMMPGKTGTELAAIVRERWPALPVVLLTGYDGDPEVVAAHQRGTVRQVVAKPWRAAELRELVAQMVAPPAAE